jgi:predicted transcriptional regulator
MAQLNTDILDAALRNGYFDSELNSDENLIVVSSVKTAWLILSALKRSPDGLDSEQLSVQTGLNQNTIRCFCLWLERAGLIRTEKIHLIGVEGKPRTLYLS